MMKGGEEKRMKRVKKCVIIMNEEKTCKIKKKNTGFCNGDRQRAWRFDGLIAAEESASDGRRHRILPC
jgi:hypothetical protein